MIVLGIDTALGACSAALVADGRTLVSRNVAMTRGHAEALAPMIQDALGEWGGDKKDIARIGVTVGPGTFTGLRVGLAFARGLALALKIPAVGVTTLEALAVAARRVAPDATTIATISDAKRGEAYFQRFDAALVPQGEPRLLSLELIQDEVTLQLRTHRIAIAGTGSIHLPARDGLVVTGIEQPDAVDVAERAGAKDPALNPPAPLYLRAPDAKLPGPSKPVPAKGHRR